MKKIALTALFLISTNAFCAAGDTLIITSVDTTQQSIARKDSLQNSRYEMFHLFFGLGIYYQPILDADANIITGIVGTYAQEHHAFTVRYIVTDGIANPDKVIRDIGILYGINVHDPFGFASFSVGLDYVDKSWPTGLIDSSSIFNPNGNTNPSYHTSSIGLAGQIQGLWYIVHGFGFGMVLYGDVSHIFSNYGILMGVQIGWF